MLGLSLWLRYGFGLFFIAPRDRPDNFQHSPIMASHGVLCRLAIISAEGPEYFTVEAQELLKIGTHAESKGQGFVPETFQDFLKELVSTGLIDQ